MKEAGYLQIPQFFERACGIEGHVAPMTVLLRTGLF